jgi:SagB-type dehydrogenase family enzyme
VSDPSPEELVIAYHERTKHHFNRFARALGYLDWATQPNPFRRYDGAPVFSLPLPATKRTTPFEQLYVDGAIPPEPLSVESLSLFFRYALSITAWKELQGSRWALRANPSSGNLHPTEAYAILPKEAGVHDRAALYHYAAKVHGLERRADLDDARFALLPAGTFLVGLSSIFWRESWKYGERAYRYCQHDVGHAVGTLRYAASLLGWRLQLLDRVSDADVERVLGLDRTEDYGEAEREHPDLLAIVAPGAIPTVDPQAAIAPIQWYGTANALSRTSIDWKVIGEVARAATRDRRSFREAFDPVGSVDESGGAFSAEHVILGRRSAVRMDGKTSIRADAFYRMLSRLVPSGGAPFDALLWRPRIHLGLFVHRVDGLRPGLYALVRDPDRLDALKKVMRGDFVWEKPAGSPELLPLHLLQEGEYRWIAAEVSCDQDIAGDGAFAVAMIADAMDSLATFGAAFYRNLFWEAGLVGQVLYLEAEAAGIRSTGIGCYYDDPTHEVFGIATREWQSFYHFTVGGPVEDQRLTTLPAYAI